MFTTLTCPVLRSTFTSEITAPKLYEGLSPAPAPLKLPPSFGEL